MSAGQRIRGQEVSVIVARDAEVETELTDIKQFNFTYLFEKKSDGFLGEGTDRKDMVFHGVKGSLEMHLHSSVYFKFIEGLKAIAQRKTPDSYVNITGVMSFANGETFSGVIANAVFGDIPVDVSARGDFVTSKWEFEASDCVGQFD